jgi:pyrroloquinoline quinone (PQQ) biosynthesis protein C
MNIYEDTIEEKKNVLIRQVKNHPFLVRCRNGEVTMDELKKFLVQQGLYSRHFTRYLCALMANLPDNEDILHLSANLFEELGLEDGSETPHHVLYRNMLTSFGINLADERPTAGTHGLINSMLQHCKDHNPASGLGAICLGAEALVPEVYSDIVAGFRANGVPDEQILFFLIHIECDDGHAETIRDIMVDVAVTDEQQINHMLAAGQALVDARLRFFDDIQQAARHA